MPDRRKHRGRHPDDDRLFAIAQLTGLRAAVADCAWLLTRAYAPDSTLKLVGDRYGLTARQRVAVMRCTCADHSYRDRAGRRVTVSATRLQPLGVDGYNLLITIESALSGGLILIGRDGCYRDLASVHGTYRKVEETSGALDTIISHLTAPQVARVDWYLDRPVSNSGRLKALMAELLAARQLPLGPEAGWNIQLVDSPDAVLAEYRGVVATTDSVILDRCTSWIDLAAEIIDAQIPDAWKVDLRSVQTQPADA